MEARRAAVVLNDICSNLVIGAHILFELLHGLEFAAHSARLAGDWVEAVTLKRGAA